ncbi:MAG: geranylgeranyl reductase family protein [Fibrobacteria bacterium]|nr:geranylgeranyl reductase family protein [Fibrobacteria bacterium]
MVDRFDLIVVGAGSAGCAAALTARKDGLSVLVLERKPFERIGDKACGDCMEEMELDWTREVLGVDLEPSVLARGLGGRVYTSDWRSHLRVPESVCPRALVDRPRLGRILRDAALESGAEIRSGVRVSDWILEDGAVRGVRTSQGEIRSRVCIDASGARTGLRAKVDLPGQFLERFDGEGRMAFAYRENLRLEKAVEHPRDIAIAYDLAASNGGYVWYFPYAPDWVNAGIGGIAAALPWSKRLDADLEARGLKVAEREVRGGAFLPARTFLSCAVAPGFLACGDAACCVGPLDGAGIHSSMLSGHLAARQASLALSRGEPDLRSLWGYHRAYLGYRWKDRIVDHGAGISALEALRPMLQKVSQRDFDTLVGHARSSTVEALYKLDLRAVPRLLAVVASLVRRPALAWRIGGGLLLLTRLRNHLLRYPDSPEEFPPWERQLRRILRSASIPVTPEVQT